MSKYLLSRRLLPIWFFITQLAGCTLALDYQRPAAPVPADWPLTAVNSGTTHAVSPEPTFRSDWRQAFPDPRLQALITAGLEHNRDLRSAIARVDEARAQAGIARVDRLPQIDVLAQRTASSSPADLSATSSRQTTRRHDINLAITAFELDFWDRAKHLDAAASSSFLATEQARISFRLTLIADIASAYFSAIELQERAALAALTLASRTESRRLLVARRDAGIAGDLDVLGADTALQTTRAELANLTRQSAAADNALRLLVGHSPDLPAGRTLSAQGLISAIPVGLPSEVLLARPDVVAAELRLQAANAHIGVARAAFFPRIALTITAGLASRGLSGLFDAGSGAWSFIPVMRLPLFEGGRSAENLEIANARHTAAVADYEKTIQQAFREIADLLAARTYLAEQLVAQEAVLVAQNARLTIVSARQQAGIANYLELLDAQRDQFAAQQSVLTLQRQKLSTVVNLYKALALY